MVKNYDKMLSRFHLIPERHGRTDRQSDRRTDGQTEWLYQCRASVCCAIINESYNIQKEMVKKFKHMGIHGGKG